MTFIKKNGYSKPSSVFLAWQNRKNFDNEQSHRVNSLRTSNAYMCHLIKRHWFRQWLIIWLMPSHYLNQCWNSVNWNLGNKPLWKLKWNSYIFIEENVKMSCTKRPPFYLSLNVLNNAPNRQMKMSNGSASTPIKPQTYGSMQLQDGAFHDNLIRPSHEMIPLTYEKDNRLGHRMIVLQCIQLYLQLQSQPQ